MDNLNDVGMEKLLSEAKRHVEMAQELSELSDQHLSKAKILNEEIHKRCKNLQITKD